MNKANVGHSILVFIRGVPGSGKSYLAAALEKSLGQDNVVMLDPDQIDFTGKEYQEFSKDLSREGLDEKIHPFRWLRSNACGASVTRKIIIWNQPFTDEGIFSRLVAFLQDYASQHGVSLPVLIVEVEVDYAIAKERVTKRKQSGGHGPSVNTLMHRINDYKSYAGQGYQTVVVNGEKNISESVSTITKALEGLKKR